jgi:hypothetical protein
MGYGGQAKDSHIKRNCLSEHQMWVEYSKNREELPTMGLYY